jgi:hypothetical protein
MRPALWVLIFWARFQDVTQKVDLVIHFRPVLAAKWRYIYSIILGTPAPIPGPPLLSIKHGRQFHGIILMVYRLSLTAFNIRSSLSRPTLNLLKKFHKLMARSSELTHLFSSTTSYEYIHFI